MASTLLSARLEVRTLRSTSSFIFAGPGDTASQGWGTGPPGADFLRRRGAFWFELRSLGGSSLRRPVRELRPRAGECLHPRGGGPSHPGLDPLLHNFAQTPHALPGGLVQPLAHSTRARAPGRPTDHLRFHLRRQPASGARSGAGEGSDLTQIFGSPPGRVPPWSGPSVHSRPWLGGPRDRRPGGARAGFPGGPLFLCLRAFPGRPAPRGPPLLGGPPATVSFPS